MPENIEAVKPWSEERPWGGFRVFVHNMPCTVKILTVKPGARLSDQRHAHRTELWRVLRGVARIWLEFADGTKSDRVYEHGSEIVVPVGTWHRLSCPSDQPTACEVLEVSTGDFDEQDIERRSDDFGRVYPVVEV